MIVCDYCKQSIAIRYQRIDIRNVSTNHLTAFYVHYPACAVKILEHYDSLAQQGVQITVKGYNPRYVYRKTYDDPFEQGAGK